MSLKTRLDGRSKNNNVILLRDALGTLIAKVTLLGNQSVTLEIKTREDVTIEKNNGWSSKSNKELKCPVQT